MECLAAGCMSGTSLDGMDVALVRICESASGAVTVKLLHFENTPLPDSLRARILENCDPGTSSVAQLCSMNVEIGELTAGAVRSACKNAGIGIRKLDFIASHGQTMYHIPQESDGLSRSTLQIGDPHVLAYRTGVRVVSNFRAMDIAAGGQGAPLVPYAEYVLYSAYAPCALQNIGGIGNVTVMPGTGQNDVFAFDTGPGNMVIDALAKRFFGVSYDKDGVFAASGTVNEPLLSRMMAVPYISAPPPKTTGREMFGRQFVDWMLGIAQGLSPEDMIATATAFTAHSIAENYRRYVFPVCAVPLAVLGGGGAYNKTLVAMLRGLLPHITVSTQEDLGFSSDAKEAVAFALLGYQTLRGRPSNLPRVTGAAQPVVLGSITPAMQGYGSPDEDKN